MTKEIMNMRQVTLKELKQIALDSKYSIWADAQGCGRDVKLYLHWSAGRYDTCFDDYHVNITGDGKIFVSTSDFSETKSHTYRRNTGSIGISLCACYNGTSNDLGDYAPTDVQIEMMARVINVLADALDLTIDIYRVMTHAEAADNYDGLYPHDPYGPSNGCERWDLAILHNGDEWMSGGDTLRGKANWYRNTYTDGVENHF